MMHFYNRADFRRALTLDLDPSLHTLLSARINALTDDLIDYTEFLVVQAGDTEADIVRHVGLSPLIDPIDGFRYGQTGFEPGWDWLAEHDGWYEMLITFGGAFAYILLIEQVAPARDDLQKLCVEYATVEF